MTRMLDSYHLSIMTGMTDSYDLGDLLSTYYWQPATKPKSENADLKSAKNSDGAAGTPKNSTSGNIATTSAHPMRLVL